MRQEHKYFLGKCDYNGSGRRNCKAYITWELKRKGTYDNKSIWRFSMCAGIWNHIHTDTYCGGQCVDDVVAYFPHNKKAQRMKEIWERYHLNDMKAGSPRQEAHLKKLDKQIEQLGDVGVALGMSELDIELRKKSHYDWATRVLTEVGLNPDNEYLMDGKPHSYGHAWCYEDIPEDIVREIQSWSFTKEKTDEEKTN